MQGIAFTALERDPDQVEVVRRFGSKVYFGDPTRPDMLRAAGAETAKLIIVGMDDPPGVLRTVEMVKQNFPKLAILARARNRWAWHQLKDREVDGLVRDTFYSSLNLSQQALVLLGIAEDAAERAVALFRDHDEKTLQTTHAIYRDEKQLIQSQAQAADELASLFEADHADRTPIQSSDCNSGRVSGIIHQTTNVATAPTAASATKASRIPASSATAPANSVLMAAPR